MISISSNGPLLDLSDPTDAIHRETDRYVFDLINEFFPVNPPAEEDPTTEPRQAPMVDWYNPCTVILLRRDVPTLYMQDLGDYHDMLW